MPRPPRDPFTNVIPLSTPIERPTQVGRPKKLKMPPLPQELLDGMSSLEQEHFWYFIDSFTQQYPDLTPTDLIALYHAAFEHINTLRLQASQLTSKQTLSMARQHSAVQLRAWLDQLSVTRKERQKSAKPQDDDKAEWQDALLRLSQKKQG